MRAFLRLWLFIWLALLVLTTGAFGVGYNRPDTPTFAYFRYMGNITHRLYLYDVQTGLSQRISKFGKIGQANWLADEPSIGFAGDLDDSWMIYTIGQGWRAQLDTPQLMSRPHPPSPEYVHLTTRMNNTVWDVLLVDNDTRQETYIEPLQNLARSPVLYWLPDHEHVITFIEAPTEIALAKVNVYDETRITLAKYPPDDFYGGVFFSSDGRWIATVLHRDKAPNELHIIDTEREQVRVIARHVTESDVVGFEPK